MWGPRDNSQNNSIPHKLEKLYSQWKISVRISMSLLYLQINSIINLHCLSRCGRYWRLSGFSIFPLFNRTWEKTQIVIIPQQCHYSWIIFPTYATFLGISLRPLLITQPLEKLQFQRNRLQFQGNVSTIFLISRALVGKKDYLAMNCCWLQINEIFAKLTPKWYFLISTQSLS